MLLGLAMSASFSGAHAASVAAVARSAAAPRPAAGPASADPHAAASATARRTGRPIGIDALTSATSTTVANPDGSFTTSTTAQATRMRTAEGWRNLDPTLRARPDGSVETVATPNRLVLSGGGTGPVVAVDDGTGHSMALSLPARLPRPTLSGATATYVGVYPGIDLVVTAQPSGGFGEVFTIHDAAAARNAENLRFSTALHGLKLTQDTAGNLYAADTKTGKALWSAPPAELWDSATGATGRQDSPETVDAAGRSSTADRPGIGAHRGRLAMTVDASGLSLGGDPARLGGATPTYPLYLDPSWQLPTAVGGTLVDGEARSGCPTATADTSRNWLSVGYNDYTSCIGADRAFYQINTSNILPSNYVISSSTLKINEVYSAWNDCNQSSEIVTIYTTGSNISGVTWNNKPSLGTEVTSKSMESVGGVTPCAGGTVPGDFDVSSAIAAARANGWANWTFALVGNETAGSHSLEGFNNNPTIVTVYDIAPNTPGTTVASPVPVRSDGTQWQGCDGNITGYLSRANWGGKTTAQLSANLSSPVSQAQVYGHFEFYDHTVSGGQEWFMNSVSVGGSGGTVSVTTPTLTDGHQYTWQVNANDGVLAGPVAHYCGFTVDISAPSNPTISSGDFQPVSSSTPSAKKAGQAGIFSVGAADPSPGSGLRGFNYSLDNPVGSAGTQFAASSGSGSLSISPAGWGVHTLYVQAVDNAGNVSATSQYTFFAPWNQSSTVHPGDVNGDGVPDLVATTSAGTLVAHYGGADPSLPPTQLSDSAHSPKGNGWNKYLVTHRGSFANQSGLDDLWAYDTAGHGLFLDKNSGTGPFQNAGNLVQITKAEVAADANSTSPTSPDSSTTGCATTSTGTCANYDNTGWSSVTQLLAVGDFYQGDTPGTCGQTAPASCDSGAPGLLTVENGSLWYYQGQQSPFFLGTAVQLGTSGWNGVTLLAPGPVNGVPTLWARDNATGALYKYTITFDAAGWPRNLGTPGSGQVIAAAGSFTTAAYPTLLSEGDVNGDGYADLFAISSNGTLDAFPGQSTAGAPVATTPSALTGSGWSSGVATVEPTVGPAGPNAALHMSAASVATGASVTADASSSTAGANPLATYAFDFGDGTTVPASSSATASHAYSALGTYTVTATVTDGAGASSSATATVTVTACPCSVLWPSKTPATVDSGDAASYELGMKVQPTVAGNITGVRFYKAAANTGTHTGSLWSASGALLATGTFTNETASGWQALLFAGPVPVQAGTTYVVSYHDPSGHYSYDAGYFSAAGAGASLIRAPQDGIAGPNGVFAAGSALVFPSTGNGGANYWVDAVFDTAGVPTGAPTLAGSTPAAGAAGTATTTQVSAVFSAPIDPSTMTFTLTDAAGAQVPATVAYTAGSDTATLTPGTQLPTSTTFTASVKATDVWGHAMSAPSTWTFTTGATGAAYSCPCTLFPSTATPATVTSGDANSVELGVRFAPTANGQITGIRFYKGPLNTGTHTGTLWNASGTQLATGTFTNETGSGWQTLTFTTPVAVTAGSTYIASYHAPNGDYSDDPGYFNYQHIVNPLIAPASTSGSGNGLYAYGTGPVFPANSASGTNYWVDVIYIP